MARSSAEELVFAAIAGQAHEVKGILDRHADNPALVNARPSSRLWGPHTHASAPEGRTALLWACQLGHMAVVRTLLAHPSCNYNAADEEGVSPLLAAVVAGHEDIAKLLVVQPAMEPGTCDKYGRCPLLEAYSHGWYGLVRMIIANEHTDVNVADKRGVTLLMRLCGSEALPAPLLELVFALLGLPGARGLDLDAVDREGWSALTHACMRGHVEVARSLLDDPRTLVPPAGTKAAEARAHAYHQVVYWGRLDAVRLLLEHPSAGVDVNTRDPQTRRPALAVACSALHYDTVRLLLAQPGVDPNARASESSYTQLMEACRVGRLELARLLLTHPGTDVNTVVQGYITPLTLSIQSRRMESVLLLLDQPGIDMYAGDKDKRTVLIFGLGSHPAYAAAMVYAGMRIPRFVRAHGAPQHLMGALDRRRAFVLWALRHWVGREALAAVPRKVMMPLLKRCGLLLHVGTV